MPELTAGALLGICALASAAAGQTASGALPAECSAYASIPLPAEAEQVPVPQTAPDCASYRSYRGIGRPRNLAEARACAWHERLAQQANLGQNPNEPTAWAVGGSLILADIYLNGAGVQRNVPLSMRFACEAEEGMATLALREIARLSASHRAQRPFEFCDYATSTFLVTFCRAFASEIEGARQSRYLNALKGSMTPEQQAAFEKLLGAWNAYIAAHASEVDQLGTIRGIRTLGSQDILRDQFYRAIVQFERKQWPALAAREVALDDRWLQREYERALHRLRARTKNEIDQGAVAAGDLSSAQKAWLSYRDAWVAFAHLRYPAAVAQIRARITLERQRLLKTVE